MSVPIDNCGDCLAEGREVAVRTRHAEPMEGGGRRYLYSCPECGHRWWQFRLYAPGESVPHWLYRIYGTEGELLCIGITRSLPSRLASHAREQSWGLEIRDVTAHWYPDEASADAAETAAVRAEKPFHNEAKTRDHIPRTAPADADPERAA